MFKDLHFDLLQCMHVVYCRQVKCLVLDYSPPRSMDIFCLLIFCTKCDLRYCYQIYIQLRLAAKQQRSSSRARAVIRSGAIKRNNWIIEY